jgi:cysteinyl-tRNA synthetase
LKQHNVDLIYESSFFKQQAREIKDWTTTDKMRDGLDAAEIVIKDPKERISWSLF